MQKVKYNSATSAITLEEVDEPNTTAAEGEESDELHKRTIQMYEMYKIKQITQEEYFVYLVELLDNWVKKLIGKSGFLNYRGVEFDDLRDSAFLKIFERAPEYDPYRTKATTFFTFYINEGFKEWVSKSTTETGQTAHYSQNIRELNKIAQKLGFSGFDDPSLTPEDLASLSGKSLKTILECRESARVSVCSYEEYAENNGTVSSPFDTPEEAMIKREKVDFVVKLLNDCSPLEKFLLMVCEIQDEKISMGAALKLLKSEKYNKMFQAELPDKIDIAFLKKIIFQARRKIRYNPETQKYFSKRELHRPIGDGFEEQASSADIESAISNGVLSLFEF